MLAHWICCVFCCICIDVCVFLCVFLLIVMFWATVAHLLLSDTTPYKRLRDLVIFHILKGGYTRPKLVHSADRWWQSNVIQHFVWGVAGYHIWCRFQGTAQKFNSGFHTSPKYNEQFGKNWDLVIRNSGWVKTEDAVKPFAKNGNKP